MRPCHMVTRGMGGQVGRGRPPGVDREDNLDLFSDGAVYGELRPS